MAVMAGYVLFETKHKMHFGYLFFSFFFPLGHHGNQNKITFKFLFVMVIMLHLFSLCLSQGVKASLLIPTLFLQLIISF